MKLNKSLAILFFLFSQIVFAQSSVNMEAVKSLVVTCTGCHGAEGVSNNPLWPNLAGQKKDYLAKQLLAFKLQERKDPLMNPIASSISEKDIDLIAEYFSSK